MTVKIIIGVAIIIASFIYILKSKKTMMDSLMEKRKNEMEAAMREADEASSEEENS